MASRYLLWNVVVAAVFLLFWGGLSLCQAHIPSDIVALALAFLLLCFYGCARLNLPEEQRWTAVVSVASCVLWTFWTLLAGLLPWLAEGRPHWLPF